MHNNNNGYPSNLAAWTTVAILMVAYVLSFIDRQILNLLVGPIRRDLAISDTEMSLLMGLSFALFYTLCGIPLGRMADNRSRRGLILFTTESTPTTRQETKNEDINKRRNI